VGARPAQAAQGTWPLSALGLLAFAAPSITIAALQLALTVHLPRYFATHMGLSLATVGAAFALVRALDIPLDPLLGMAMDRTRSRFGRYRLWAIGGPPVVMAALYGLMHPAGAPSQAYLVSLLLVMYLGYSAMYLAQLAWAGALAGGYQARSRIFAAIVGLGVVGAVGVLVAPILLTRGGHSEAEGVEAMIWLVIVSAPLCTLLMVARTPEPITPAPSAHFRLADYAALLLRPNVRRLMAADFFIQLGPGWMAALYLFEFTTNRGFSAATANLLLLSYLAAGFVGAPLASWLARRINKHRALAVCTTLFPLCVAGLPFLPRGAFGAALALMVVAGLAFAGFLVLLRAITADIADEARLESGREQLGLLFALTNATTKLATAGGDLPDFPGAEPGRLRRPRRRRQHRRRPARP
jgi:GPH family glycoside/pentoside/hexuronide:cation symporter